MRWKNDNFKELSRICSTLCLADTEVDILLRGLAKLEASNVMPKSVRELRREEKRAIASTGEVLVIDSPIPIPIDNAGEPMITTRPCQVIMYDLMTIMGNLINHDAHAEHIHWQFEPEHCGQGKRIYSELWTTDWWDGEQSRLPCGRDGKILAIGLASDETLVTLGDRKVHPIYVFCGNLHRWYKNHGSSWSLLGFFPVIKCSTTVSSRPLMREYKRRVRTWAMGVITEQIVSNKNGFIMNVRDTQGQMQPTFVYPRLAVYAADELEQRQSIYGGFGGRCNMPCRTCCVTPRHPNALTDGLKRRGELRKASAIMRYFDESTKSSTMPSHVSMRLSIHTEYNPLFFVPGFNPLMNPPCRMHQTEGGIFKTMIGEIVMLLKATGGGACVAMFDKLWSCVIPFPGIKIFRNGVCDVANVTASEHRTMSVCLPFVLRGVDGAFQISEKADRPSGFLEYLAYLYLAWRWVLGLEMHDVESLDLLDGLGFALQEELESLKRVVKGQPDFIVTEGPKFHAVLHWTHWIRTYGATGNYNTEIFELAHRLTIKIWQQKLSMRSNYAERKVMRQYSIYAGFSNMPTMEDGATSRRWGKGCFRGLIDLEQELALSSYQKECLCEFEGSSEFMNLPVEHLKERYATLIGASRPFITDVPVLVAVLESNKDFMNFLRTHTPDLTDNCNIQIFSADSISKVVLWRKSYFSPRGCYLTEGSFVMYTPNLGTRQSGIHLGCVRWLLSIGTLQFMVVQRLRRDRDGSAFKSNERLHDSLMTLLMLRDGADDCDRMRRVLKGFRMSDGAVLKGHECYEILILDNGNAASSSSSPITDHVCMQLDMKHGAEANMAARPFDYPNLRLFLSELMVE